MARPSTHHAASTVPVHGWGPPAMNHVCMGNKFLPTLAFASVRRGGQGWDATRSVQVTATSRTASVRVTTPQVGKDDCVTSPVVLASSTWTAAAEVRMGVHWSVEL